MDQPRRLAAIDIGTSSVHLAIAEPTSGGRPTLVLREKLPVRLGSGATDMKTLDPAAVDRALEALTHFRALADAHNADVCAVATSAVRESEDPSDFLRRALEEASIEIEVIPGVEEARLIHLGVMGALPFADRRHLVIDIGGGSTEIILADGTTPLLTRSLKIGHVRLKNRFFPDGTVTDDAVTECRRFVRSFLARVASEIGEIPFDVAAGASGTFETVEALARDARPAGAVHAGIRRSEVDAVVQRVLAARTPADRLVIPGIEPHRVDTIPAGVILVETLMESLGFAEFLISPDALREGLVLDRLHQRDPSPDTLLHLSAIRSSSVHAEAERYGENIVHARQATDIALQLFDATGEMHSLGEYERDVLEAASMLHNIGRFVGHGAHHHHSYYLIRNSEHLAGFNDHELELIALVARYHRKSEPKPTHTAFRELNGADQLIVMTLAGMLRLGIALDRTYRNVATDLQIGVNERIVSVEVLADAADIDVELFAANARKGLLERALDCELDIRARASTDVS